MTRELAPDKRGKGYGALHCHPDYVPPNLDGRPVEKAVRILAPTRARAAVVAIFDGRATLTAIENWRLGRRAVPQWVQELLQRKVAEAAHLDFSNANGPGRGWRRKPNPPRDPA